MHPFERYRTSAMAPWKGLATFVVAGLAVFLLAAAPPGAAGAKAPDFEIEALDGATVRLSELRGKTVVLHFWATWCPHCLSEMPVLEEAASRLRARDVEVLAINLGEPRKKVDRYVREHDLTLKVLLDRGGKVAEAYRVVGLPATIVVDPAGRVVRQIEMGSLSKSELEKLPSQLETVRK